MWARSLSPRRSCRATNRAAALATIFGPSVGPDLPHPGVATGSHGGLHDGRCLSSVSRHRLLPPRSHGSKCDAEQPAGADGLYFFSAPHAMRHEKLSGSRRIVGEPALLGPSASTANKFTSCSVRINLYFHIEGARAWPLRASSNPGARFLTPSGYPRRGPRTPVLHRPRCRRPAGPLEPSKPGAAPRGDRDSGAASRLAPRASAPRRLKAALGDARRSRFRAAALMRP